MSWKTQNRIYALAVIIIGLFLVYQVKSANVLPTDDITIVGQVVFNDGNIAAGDSMQVIVLVDGSSVHSAWYNTADPQLSSVGNWLVFTDQLQDIDGAGGNGNYLIMAQAYFKDSTIYGPPTLIHYEVGVPRFDPATDVVASVTNVTTTGTVTNAVTVTGTPDVNVASVDANAIDLADLNGPTAWYNEGKTGYSISGTITTLDGLNNFNPTTDAVATVTGVTNPVTVTGTPNVNVTSVTTNAIELTDFSGPTGWWNEGKTGYTLTVQDWTTDADLPTGFAALYVAKTDSIIGSMLIRPGTLFRNQWDNDHDTTWFIIPGISDSIGLVLYHEQPADSAGAAPDSGKVIGPQ